MEGRTMLMCRIRRCREVHEPAEAREGEGIPLRANKLRYQGVERRKGNGDALEWGSGWAGEDGVSYDLCIGTAFTRHPSYRLWAFITLSEMLVLRVEDHNRKGRRAEALLLLGQSGRYEGTYWSYGDFYNHLSHSLRSS